MFIYIHKHIYIFSSKDQLLEPYTAKCFFSFCFTFRGNKTKIRASVGVYKYRLNWGFTALDKMNIVFKSSS